MPAIHAKALYDISNGFKTKNEKPIQQGLSSIQDLAKKRLYPCPDGDWQYVCQR